MRGRNATLWNISYSHSFYWAALLRSDWRLATSLLLRPRPGEYPETEAGRRAWTEEKDLEKALRLIPRRCVAERDEFIGRAIGDTSKSTPYVRARISILRVECHRIRAYQVIWSYPVVGDVVYDDEGTNNSSEREKAMKTKDIDDLGNGESEKRMESGKRTAPRKVKILAEEDLPHYSMFDIVMPLPGTDVAGGELGNMYREFLKLDGLDPNDFKT
ncbi:pseudouridine synthase [Rhizoctonia solani]|uniref:Pseudouridine synthase n=1 Tax=Rhizoctonia solani TaxID=456999 RepID=A0A8H8NP86_9AGAM|nr:pseudouridine synthase [Rhizoctonia solani]QRW16173.1 pseudouridine synthase [Rhizoctonia solani]